MHKHALGILDTAALCHDWVADSESTDIPHLRFLLVPPCTPADLVRGPFCLFEDGESFFKDLRQKIAAEGLKLKWRLWDLFLNRDTVSSCIDVFGPTGSYCATCLQTISRMHQLQDKVMSVLSCTLHASGSC
jgi:hypothetical protein